MQKEKWLLLPWLIVSGLAVPGAMLGSAAVVCLVGSVFQQSALLLALPVTLLAALLTFPTWFTALHVFAALAAEQDYRPDQHKRQDYVFKYFYS